MRDWQRETTYFSCFTSFGPTRRWRYSTCSPLSLGSQPPAGMPSHCITLRKSRAEVLQQVFLETAKDFFSFLVVSFSASFCLWMLQIPRQRWWQWWWESFVVPLSAQVRAWRYCLSAFFFCSNMIDNGGSSPDGQHCRQVFFCLCWSPQPQDVCPSFCLSLSVSLLPGSSECLAPVKICSSLIDLPPGSSDVKRWENNHSKSSA